MNLVLIGMMGAGKTTVGKALALLTGKKFLDTDLVLEQRFGSISAIFGSGREEKFRALERELVLSLAREDGLVLSTGGGTVLDGENVRALKEKGILFYLKAAPETLARRIGSGEGRPLLCGAADRTLRLRELLSVRENAYEAAADFLVETDGKSVEAVAEEIANLAEGEEKR